MKINLLAIGAHPDDIELGCGGTLLKHKNKGFTTGIIDLTKGELGTRGSAEIRTKEAKLAAKLLNVDIRNNLMLTDGFFENNKKNQLKLIKLIRKYKPDVILTNAYFDRHPDHGRAARLVNDSCFLSGLAKIKDGQKPWRPKNIYNYIQFNLTTPNLLVDISNHIDVKMNAILAYKSQFYNPSSKEPETVISKKSFIEGVRHRSANFGRIVGVDYAEAFTVNKPIGSENLMNLT